MQEIIIIAGPNGAGKTSFANEYLSSFRGRFVFLNADEVAREIASANLPLTQLDWRAGREMLTRINDCVDAGLNVAFETTLRVRRRVAQGGHGVPEDAIRKRFSKSLDYFDRLYRPLVNEWYIWDSLEGRFQPAEKWDD
jgi:predicted ABC-type ATPase